MAKQTDQETPSQEPTAPQRGSGRFLHYSLVLLLAGLVLLVWLSLLTFNPADPPSGQVYAARRTVHNAAGRVGASLAHTLRYWVGGGVYIAAIFGSAVAGVLLTGRTIRDLPWRVIGMLILVASFSSMLYMANPVQPDRLAAGASGVLGTSMGHFLLVRFGSSGGWLIVLMVLAIGALLAGDDVLIRGVRLAIRGWHSRGRVREAVGALAPRVRGRETLSAPEPAPAGAGTASRAVRPSRPARPARNEADAADAEIPVARPVPAPAPAPAPAKPAPALEKPRENKKPIPVPASPKGQRPKSAPQPGEDADDDAYTLPSAELLAVPKGGYLETMEAQAAQKSVVLQQTLDNFQVEATVLSHMTGPCITMFELQLAPGVKVAKIANLSTDLARALAVPGVRIVSPIPGKDTVGIEVPNSDREMVRIRELMDMAGGRDQKMHLPLYLGKDASGDPIIADLAAMPHMLLAGTTGSGKSVCINSIIMSMLLMRTPEEVRLILIDPKMVELAAFDNIPHLLCPIVNDMRKAEEILEWAATKMDERYELLKEAGVRNIAGYNRLSPKDLYERLGAETPEEQARIPQKLPYQVIIIDELADLMMTSSKEVELHIIRIAQKARAVGIHLVLATQRPSVDVVTGLIKSNMPCRISFRVASRQESRIILDQNGAEVLMGQGDMLFLKPGTSTVLRSQGTYVEDGEIHTIVKELKSRGDPKFDAELMKLNSAPVGEGGGEKDDLFDQAVEIILNSQRGSVSLLQRKLQVGYTRASRIVDQMAEAGILGDYKGSQARECLLSLEDWHAMQASIAADQSGDSSLDGEPTSV